MDLTTNLVKHVKNTYTYKVHTSPIDYCKKLIQAGSKSGKIIKKGSDIELDKFIYFYGLNELRAVNQYCIEACIMQYKGKQVFIDWGEKTFTVQNATEDLITELLTIFYTTDNNMEEVWNNLIEQEQGVSQ